MIESLLRRLIEHKRRKWIVIILTVLTGLLVVLPAVDEYNAAKERINAATDELLEAQAQGSSVEAFDKIRREKEASLEALEEEAVSAENEQAFRDRLDKIVQGTGCTMRRIQMGQPFSSVWKTNDHPLNTGKTSDRGNDTPYQLEKRRISLEITGSIGDLYDFLSEVNKLEKLIHTKSVSLEGAARGENTAVLEMELIAFNLVKKAAP
jgi:hypothetical protein